MELLTVYPSLGVLPVAVTSWLVVIIIDTFDVGQADLSTGLFLQAVLNAVSSISWASWGYFLLLFQLLFLGNASASLHSLLRESR